MSKASDPGAQPQLWWLGDAALSIVFGREIDARVNARVHRAVALFSGPAWSEVADRVPAYASLTLALREHAHIERDAFAARVVAALRDDVDTDVPASTRLVTIPVVYGGEYGPDLDALAQYTKLSVDDVIARHSAVEYRVAMLGFQPGFPYLIGLDPTLTMPRRPTPRPRVPAGSVAIGGAQTGIYPGEAPGGWQLIGRAAARLFDTLATPPTLLQPGDALRFVAITPAQFARARVEIAHV
jgi:KipI family sensor histidine kinase inhibitor